MTATTPGPAQLRWPGLGGGPIAALAPPAQLASITRELRGSASRHGDTAWVHPAPADDKTCLPNMSQALLDAIGVVGLHDFRAYGETHLIRPLSHLVHGPVRHVIIDDAHLLNVLTLDALQEAALIARVQLWLLFDASENPAGRPATKETPYEWLRAVCVVTSPASLTSMWNRRFAEQTCSLPTPSWWHHPVDSPSPWTDRCATPDTHPTPTAQVECLLSRTRRALTAGHTTPAHARDRLLDLADHRDTTVEHRAVLTAADRNLYTPGHDVLGQTHINAQLARLADVTPNGAKVRVAAAPYPDGEWVDVHPMHQPAIARLRTSRRLAGCLADEPVTGIFDQLPGPQAPRRRPPSRR